MTRRVAVVGAGAVGTTAAADLAAAGVETILFERETVGGGSTGRAAGIVYDAFADARDARIADRALERFRELDVGFQEVPYVAFAHEGDDRRGSALREAAGRMRENGRDVSVVDPRKLGDRYPALRVNDLGTAFVARNAGCLSPATYARAMAERARDAGADVREHTAIRVADLDGFDAVLVAAGAHTGVLLAAAGAPVAVEPYRVQALTTRDAPDVPICYDATGGYYFRPHESGLLAGDGTVAEPHDPDDWDRDADREFRETTLDRLGRRLPGVSHRVSEAWAGLCTATPDGDPLLGAVREGLYCATGWHGHGVMRAPALGERIAGEIAGGQGVGAFDPTRVPDEPFEIREGMGVE